MSERTPRIKHEIENGVTTVWQEVLADAPTLPPVPTVPATPPVDQPQDFIPLPPALAGKMVLNTWHWELPKGSYDQHSYIAWAFGDGSTMRCGFVAARCYKAAGSFPMRCVIVPRDANRKLIGAPKTYGWDVVVEPDTRKPIFSLAGIADDTRIKLTSSSALVMGKPIEIRHKNVVIELGDNEIRHASGDRIIFDMKPEAEQVTIVGGILSSPGKAYGEAPIAFDIQGRGITVIKARARNRLSKFFNIEKPKAGRFVLIQDCHEDDPSPKSVIDLHYLWDGGENVCIYDCTGKDAPGEHYIRANNFRMLAIEGNNFATTDEPDFAKPYKDSTRKFVRTALALQMGEGASVHNNTFGAECALGPGVNNNPLPGTTVKDETLTTTQFEDNHLYHGGIVAVRGNVDLAIFGGSVTGWYEDPSKGWEISTKEVPGTVVRPEHAIELGHAGPVLKDEEGKPLRYPDGREKRMYDDRTFKNVSISGLKTNCKLYEVKTAPDGLTVDGVKQ